MTDTTQPVDASTSSEPEQPQNSEAVPTEQTDSSTESTPVVDSAQDSTAASSDGASTQPVDETAASATGETTSAAVDESASQGTTQPETAPEVGQSDVPAESTTADAEAEQAAILEENRTYYVIDGAPLLVRESDKPHELRGEVTLGSSGKDVTLAGRLVVPDASSVVSSSGASLFGTTGAGQIPVDQGGKLGALLPTEAGQVLTLVTDEATGAVIPAWRSVPEPELPPTKTSKRLFLAKDADQIVDKMVQTNVSGWADAGAKLAYRNDFGFDVSTGVLTIPADATENVDLDVYFQATVQAGSTTGSVTAFVLVDSGNGFESVAEQTARSGPSTVYPFPLAISAFPTLAPGSKLAIALWHDSSAPINVVGGASTTLSVLGA
jgi:hypothetical protein